MGLQVTDFNVVLTVEVDVCSKSLPWIDVNPVNRLTAGQVGENIAQIDPCTYVFTQFTGISYVDGELIRTSLTCFCTCDIGKNDVTQREIPQRDAEGLVVVQFFVATQVSQVNVVDQLLEPWSIGERKAHFLLHKSQFGRIPENGICIGGNRNTQVAHTT